MRDLVQPAVAAVDEVLEPARAWRRRPRRRRAARSACRPIDIPPTTVASRSLQRAGVRGERVGDLLGQLAGGYEDQGQRLPGLGALPGGTGQQRQAEGEGLAGAGAAAAEDVPAGEGVRQGRGLDRERHGHALRGERRQQRARACPVGERLDGGQRRGDRHRQGELPCGAAAATASGRSASAAGRSRRGARRPPAVREAPPCGVGRAAVRVRAIGPERSDVEVHAELPVIEGFLGAT